MVFITNLIRRRKYKNRKEKRRREIEKYNKLQDEYNTKLKYEKQKHNYKSILSKLKFETYTKRLVAFVVVMSMLDIQLSYVLAFMDKIQIAESLSNQVCTTLLGTVLVYAVRAYFDTKAEKHDEMIKEGYLSGNDSIKNTINNVIKSKVSNVVDNTGVSEHIDIDELNQDTSSKYSG